jgi:predicted transport protein
MSGKVDAATANMIKNLEEKTGKKMAEWVKIAKSFGEVKHGQIVKELKEKHGLGHGYANLVAHTAAGAVGADAPAGDDLVAAQYAGEKAALKPIYDSLIRSVSVFGKDIEISPKKTYVSLRRSKQFALIQPSTKARIDVGINLKGIAPAGRLEASGSFNAMCTHRVRVESARDVDEALIGWLKQAYDAA